MPNAIWSDVAAPATWRELSALFKAERARRGESLRDVAAATGCAFTTLGRFEREEDEPRASLFIAVWSWIVQGRD